MKILRKFSCLSICLYLVGVFFNPLENFASLEFSQDNEKREFNRILEKLLDFDYRTWQLVVYSSPDYSGRLILQIVCHLRELRIEHPINLIARSGIKNSNLKDITLKNNKLPRDLSEGAAEFEITPLITDLRKNRPLRLSLTGVFSDLLIPPLI